MTTDLRGRTALVTGGSRGIGAAVVRALADAGITVAINYRARADTAARLARSIDEAGGRAVAIAADVSQADAVARLVERAQAELGPIDILVNNAGIAITRGIDDLSEDDFDRTIAVNLKSVFLRYCPACGPGDGAASSTYPRVRPAAPARSGHIIMRRRPASKE